MTVLPRSTARFLKRKIAKERGTTGYNGYGRWTGKPEQAEEIF
jgi:hypothetical protein